MRKITVALITLLLVPVGARADQAARAWDAPALDAPVSEAPEAWSQQDPADSLYRAARDAMSRRSHERAADLFERIWRDYPESTYAPNAVYWEAFNRYRLDDPEELEEALALLELQADRYPEASTRTDGDAQSLATRIRGLLARRGDESAARAIVAATNEMAGMGAAIGAEVARAMEGMAGEIAAQSGEIARAAAMAAEQGAMIGAALGSARTDDLPQECREEAETQLAALNALIHMRSERALPVLRQVMERRDPCSVVLRRRAVFLIADKGGPETVDLLLDVAADDPDIEVRRQAVFWLSEVDDQRAVDALSRFVFESDDEVLRERAIFALSQHDSPRAMEVIRRVARDDGMPGRLRSRAVFWLAEEGTAEDVDVLKQMFGQVENEDLAEQILFAVGQTERAEDARWLLGVAEDEDVSDELRSRAIFWAAEAGISAQQLGRLYGRVDSKKLKERIIFGLSESSEPGAIDRLIEIARTETDPELRSRAIFWLGNSNDERAAEVLMDILSNPGGGG